MPVAVAGVKDVGDAQVVPGADRSDLRHDLRQSAARHDAVLHVVVRRESPQSAECALAPFPQALPFCLILGEPDLTCPPGGTDGLHDGRRSRSLLAYALELHEQHRVGVAGIPDWRPPSDATRPSSNTTSSPST